MNNQIPAVKCRVSFGQSTVWGKHALNQEALNRMRRDLKRIGARRPAKQEQQKSVNSEYSYCNSDFHVTVAACMQQTHALRHRQATRAITCT